MKIALIQAALFWENPKANNVLFEDKINQIEEPIDLIVLPEMFTSGFTMNPVQIAATYKDTLSWMQSIAKIKNCALTGSLIAPQNQVFCNRLVFVFPSGEYQIYDKRHLFALAGEDKVYTAGRQKLIIEYKGFKICPLICYDLRFPVFSRNTEDYDLLLYVANWPKLRTNAWDILLRARSIENMCYTIGVNRIGRDANNYEYIGHSQAVDYLGNYILEPQETENVFIVNIDKNEMIETREKLAFLMDRDTFQILD
jgi:omega-amidase